jgi:hypothetical protein
MLGLERDLGYSNVRVSTPSSTGPFRRPEPQLVHMSGEDDGVGEYSAAAFPHPC